MSVFILAIMVILIVAATIQFLYGAWPHSRFGTSSIGAEFVIVVAPIMIQERSLLRN